MAEIQKVLTPTTMLTVTLAVGDKVLDTLIVNPEDAQRATMADRSVPIVKFFDRGNAPKLYHDCGDGRRHRLSPAEIARHSTGRDRSTGQWSLGIGVESRGNMVKFTGDLWKLGCDLASGALAFLADLWRLQNAETSARLLKRMEHYFGPTHFQFDALPEQVKDWQAFLAGVMSREDFYSPIERWR